MHFLKSVTWFAHTLGAVWFDMVLYACSVWGAWDSTGAAGAEEPPPKKPPMAWPIEEPTATPLYTRRN